MGYATPPAKAEISATPSPSNAVAKAGFGKLWDFVIGLLGSTGNPEDAHVGLKVLPPDAFWNLKLNFSLPGGNVLRATMTDKDGNTLSSDDPGFISIRSGTLSSGSFNSRKLTAAISLDLPSGASFGHSNNVPGPLFWYLIESDAATRKIAVSGSYMGMSGLFSTTLISGASTSRNVLYADAALTNKPGRLIGMTLDTQTVAGTWIALPSEVRHPPFDLVRGVTAVGRNLAVKSNAVSPLSKVDVTADRLVAEDDYGNVVVMRDVAVSMDLAVAGENGLDTGAEAPSTWYYGWVLSKPDGTRCGVWSTSFTRPTMPAGYTAATLVTAAFNGSGSDLSSYYQFGNEICYQTAPQVANVAISTVETSVDVSTFIPPIAQSYSLSIENSVAVTAANGGYTYNLRLVSGVLFLTLRVINGSGTNTQRDTSYVTVPNVGQQFFHIRTATVSVSTVGTAVYLTKFKLPLGGE